MIMISNKINLKNTVLSMKVNVYREFETTENNFTPNDGLLFRQKYRITSIITSIIQLASNS